LFPIYRSDNGIPTNNTLKRTEGAITNGQSRDSGNIEHSRHRMKTNKTKHTTQKTEKRINTDHTNIESKHRCSLSVNIFLPFYSDKFNI